MTERATYANELSDYADRLRSIADDIHGSGRMYLDDLHVDMVHRIDTLRRTSPPNTAIHTNGLRGSTLDNVQPNVDQGQFGRGIEINDEGYRSLVKDDPNTPRVQAQMVPPRMMTPDRRSNGKRKRPPRRGRLG